MPRTLDELVNMTDMDTLNLFDFNLSEGPVMSLVMDGMAISVAADCDEFGNYGWLATVRDLKGRIHTESYGTDVKKILSEALADWIRESAQIVGARIVVNGLLSKLKSEDEK